MSFRCLSSIAFLMAGNPASGPFAFRAWMSPQRTWRGMGRSSRGWAIMTPPRGLLAAPAGQSARAAQVVLQVQQGLARGAQLLRLHPDPHVLLHRDAAHEHDLDAVLVGLGVRFRDAGARLPEARAPDALLVRAVGLGLGRCT